MFALCLVQVRHPERLLVPVTHFRRFLRREFKSVLEEKVVRIAMPGKDHVLLGQRQSLKPVRAQFVLRSNCGIGGKDPNWLPTSAKIRWQSPI